MPLLISCVNAFGKRNNPNPIAKELNGERVIDETYRVIAIIDNKLIK